MMASAMKTALEAAPLSISLSLSLSLYIYLYIYMYKIIVLFWEDDGLGDEDGVGGRSPEQLVPTHEQVQALLAVHQRLADAPHLEEGRGEKGR
jgi:hypothetical protein